MISRNICSILIKHALQMTSVYDANFGAETNSEKSLSGRGNYSLVHCATDVSALRGDGVRAHVCGDARVHDVRDDDDGDVRPDPALLSVPPCTRTQHPHQTLSAALIKSRPFDYLR